MYYAEYIIGLLAVSSFLMAWFDTDIMVHLLHLLRKLGWRKSDPEWWHPIPEHETTKDDLDMYLAGYGKYPLLDKLLSCPVCFSFHLSFWVSLVMYLLHIVPVEVALAQTLSYPVLSNAILRLMHKL